MRQKIVPPRCVILSRTDKIGDVVLTLPMAGVIKKMWPQTKIIFLGQPYTLPVIECSVHVDHVWTWDNVAKLTNAEARALCEKHEVDAIVHVFPKREIADWAKRVGIPLRIGTRNRIFHWLSCNHLVGVSRRHSNRHEAELNLALLHKITGNQFPEKEKLQEYYGLSPKCELRSEFAALLDDQRVNLILHPKSKGSAREWPLKKWRDLALGLPSQQYKIFISGGPDEAAELLQAFPKNMAEHIVNIAGTMPLNQFVSFIAAADGLVAASTGPLHIAAAFGRHTLGLYPPIRPMHGGRWGPLGLRANFVSVEKNCEACRHNGSCACMENIEVNAVREKLEKFSHL